MSNKTQRKILNQNLPGPVVRYKVISKNKKVVYQSLEAHNRPNTKTDIRKLIK